MKKTTKVTKSNEAPMMSETVASVVEETKVCKVNKLEASFGNGEVNQVVEKLNEVIDAINKCQ